MITLPKNVPFPKTADKEAMIQALDRILEASELEYDPDITPEELQQRMRDAGIRPEENILSRELLRMRYPEEYPDPDEKN